jgi:hypothetical protein
MTATITFGDDDESRHSGVYEYLRRRVEEQCARRPEYTEDGRGGFFRCPDYRRLEAIRSGEPVSVPGYLLPRAVRASAAFQAAAGEGRIQGRNMSRSLTATVWPDDRIQYRDETAREWMENEMPEELYGNTSGMPMELYRLQPTRHSADNHSVHD